MFSLICARINGWVNNREAGDLKRHRDHYDVIVMIQKYWMLLLIDVIISDKLCVPKLLLLNGLTLIPGWIDNHVHHNVWNEITYPFPNLDGTTVEVREWISKFIPRFTGHMIIFHVGMKIYFVHVSKRGHPVTECLHGIPYRTKWSTDLHSFTSTKFRLESSSYLYAMQVYIK